MAETTMVNFRMETELKRNMENVCREMGISMTTAFISAKCWRGSLEILRKNPKNDKAKKGVLCTFCARQREVRGERAKIKF